MAKMNTGDDTDWKDRYFSSLNEHELAQRSWQDKTHELYKALLRMAFSYYGQDQRLDEQINDFRTLIRQGAGSEQRDRMLQGIVDTIMRLEPPDEPTHSLVKLIEGLPFPERLKSSARSLCEKLSRHAEQRLGAELLGEMQALLSEAMTQGPAPASAQQHDQIKLILLHLLDYCAFPVAMEADVNTLKQTLERADQELDVDTALARVADLVQLVQSQLREEVREMGEFLLTITDRLDEIGQHLQIAENVRNEAHEDTRALNTAVEEHVRGIRASVDMAMDITELKNTIEQRLHIIDQSMNHFVRTEDSRADRSEKAIKALKQRLEDMEEETNNLRRSIRAEHARALTDGLTGIPNRLAYDERIGQEHARWKRMGTPLSLMVMDIDHFKAINDEFGHAAGDKALTHIARLLSSEVRETDFLARYGGEEFALLLPDTGLEAALGVGDKLRQTVAQAHFHFKDADVPITISCGLAEFHDGDDAQSCFNRADAAMYLAKQHGRNCCKTERELKNR